MAGQRYRAGVLPVMLSGVDRPALAALLAQRGLTVRASSTQFAAALLGEGVEWPHCPVLVEVRSPEGAGHLLDNGADDVVLPTDPDTLVAARIAALVRRTRHGLVRVGEIAIDTVERRVTVSGRALRLLPREYALLNFLAQHVGVPVDHATLHQAIWGRDFHPGTNVIAVHVSRLRGKLADSGVTLITDRGRGYRLAIAGPGGAG